MPNLHKILLILLVLFNFIFALQIKSIFAVEPSLASIIYGALLFFPWAITIGLNLLLVKNKFWQVIAFGLGALTFLITGINIFTVLAVALLFGMLFYVRWDVEYELKNDIVLMPFNAIYRHIWFFLMAMFLLISVIYYTSPHLINYKLDLEVPRGLFDTVFSLMNIAPQGVGFDLNSIGIGADEQTLQEEAYKSVNNYLQNLTRPYKTYAPGILAIGLFVGLQTISWPLRFLIASLTNLVFKLLVRFGVVRKRVVKVDKEELV